MNKIKKQSRFDDVEARMSPETLKGLVAFKDINDRKLIKLHFDILDEHFEELILVQLAEVNMARDREMWRRFDVQEGLLKAQNDIIDTLRSLIAEINCEVKENRKDIKSIIDDINDLKKRVKTLEKQVGIAV